MHKGPEFNPQAASQDQEEEASMQRIASGCWGVGQAGGSEHPVWTVMFWQLMFLGGCLAVAQAQQSSLLGSHPAIVWHPLPSTPGESDFPT